MEGRRRAALLLGTGVVIGVLVTLFWPFGRSYEQCMIDKMRGQPPGGLVHAYGLWKHLPQNNR
jgi:hypothetical protein